MIWNPPNRMKSEHVKSISESEAKASTDIQELA